MKKQWLLLSVLAILLGFSSGTVFQIVPIAEAAELSSGSDVPRLSNGRPDLSGIWQALVNANDNLEPAAPKAAYQLVPGDFVPVPHPDIVAMGAVGAVPASFGVVEGGMIPYTPEARERQQANQMNWLELDPEIKCYMPGVPRANYMPHPFQIFHNENAFFIAYSFAGAVRDVFLENPGEAPLDSWMGQSYGYWDGDTWVVEVTGLNDSTWLDRAGNWHTYQLKVTERYDLISENVIMYTATLEDPEIYTRPWTIQLPLYRRLEEGFELPQFKCVEFVEELMYSEYRKGGELEQRLREEMLQELQQ